MFLRLLTIATICLVVKGEGQEIMNPNPDYLMKLVQLRSPAFFKSACTPAAADLVFALDGSASIHVDYFTKGKELISKSVAELNGLGLLGSSDSQTRVGAFQFGKEDYMSFPLLTSATEIDDGLKGIFYQNSSLSRIADAIDWVLTEKNLFGGPKRGSAKRVLAILTDCLDNCVSAQETAAKANADKAGVEVVLVTYTGDVGSGCVDSLTGGDKSKHHLWSDVSGVSTLTTDCPTTAPPVVTTTEHTEGPHHIDCYYNSTAYCVCKEGFTGPNCSKAINYCHEDVDYDGSMIPRKLCHNGDCHYDPETGSSCKCHTCFYGDFCEHLNTSCTTSQRCIAYDNPDYTGKITYRCDITHERCIPDDLNCMLNMPLAHKNGTAYCPQEKRSPCDGVCKCKKPTGWCIKLEAYNGIYRAAVKAAIPMRQFIIPEEFTAAA